MDIGTLVEELPDLWAIIMKKGYPGLSECARAIHPKKSLHGQRTVGKGRRNKRAESYRIIVRNFFGRLCGVWNNLSAKYRWPEHLYDEIFRLCMGLSNLHIKRHTKLEEDINFYQKIMNRR